MDKKNLLNNQGMTLVEVMIVVTIMSMVGLGTATMMSNVNSVQRRATLKVTAAELQSNLETLLRNDRAWANSINSATNDSLLGCLRDSVTNPANYCQHGIGNSIANFEVRDSAGDVFFQSNTQTIGFNQDGETCNTYVQKPNAGNDACPFRYNLTWYALCPNGEVSCRKPQVIIVGDFEFNPANPADSRNRINEDDFNIEVRRGERVRYEPFEVEHRQVSSDPGVDGQCHNTIGTWKARPLNQEVYDDGDNVVLAGNTLTIQPGRYECEISAQSYGIGAGFNIRFQDTTNAVAYPVGGGTVQYGVATHTTGSFHLDLSAVTNFQLQQRCENNLGSDRQYNFGLPIGSYSATDYTVFSTITCVRSS